MENILFKLLVTYLVLTILLSMVSILVESKKIESIIIKSKRALSLLMLIVFLVMFWLS